MASLRTDGLMNYRYTRSSISFGGPITPRVKMIIIACIIVFLMQVISGGLRGPVTSLFSLRPVQVVDSFFIWQLFTYIFLHADVFHLLINMLILFMFGCELERYWGNRQFWRYFVVAGVGAGFCVMVVNLFSPQGSTLGASGAIYGLLLAYGLSFPNRIIFVMLLFPVPAKYAVLIFGGIAFLSSISGSSTRISHSAHLGGMLVGYLYLKLLPYRIGSGQSWLQLIQDAYSEYKLRRAKRKFSVYLSKKAEGRDKNKTIH